MRLATSALLLAFAATPAFADDIPFDLHGLWAADGECGIQSAAIMVDENTIRFQDADEPARAEYWPDDSPRGNGAIHFAEEGNVSNWEYDPDNDLLLYNESGYGMGVPPIVYSRCTERGDYSAGDEMPEVLTGIWALDGNCDDPDSLIEIGYGTVQFAGGAPDEVYYTANDSPRGNGALHWAEEGIVSNLEYDIEADRVHYNEAGYGMGIAPAVYFPCAP